MRAQTTRKLIYSLGLAVLFAGAGSFIWVASNPPELEVQLSPPAADDLQGKRELIEPPPMESFNSLLDKRLQGTPEPVTPPETETAATPPPPSRPPIELINIMIGAKTRLASFKNGRDQVANGAVGDIVFEAMIISIEETVVVVSFQRHEFTYRLQKND